MTQSTKILHVVPYAEPTGEYGGPARGTFKQARAARGVGYVVDVLSLGKHRAIESREGTTYHQFKAHQLPIRPPSAGVYSIIALYWAARNLRKYNLIHIHAGREIWVLILMRIARLMHVPYIWQTHGMVNPWKPLGIRIFDAMLTKPAMRSASALLSLTSYEDSQLRRLDYSANLERLINGIEDPVTTPPTLDSSDILRVVFVSRIHPRKRVLDLVNATLELESEGIKLHLDIYGPDGGNLAALKARISDAGGTIKYRGSLKYEDVRATIAKYDLLALPSVLEPFPNILLEAMASAVPVLCTHQCGIASDISEYAAGIVIDPGVESLMEALRDISKAPSSLSLYRDNGLTLVKDRFSITSMWERLNTIYRKYSWPEPADVV